MLLLPLIPPMYTNPQIESKKNNECVDERKNVSLLSPPGIKFKKIIGINDIAMSAHSAHAHYLAKGGNLKVLFDKVPPCSPPTGPCPSHWTAR